MAKKPIVVTSVEDLKRLTDEERRGSRPLVFDFQRRLGETDEELEARLQGITRYITMSPEEVDRLKRGS